MVVIEVLAANTTYNILSPQISSLILEAEQEHHDNKKEHTMTKSRQQ
jgi:hypothetical protein